MRLDNIIKAGYFSTGEATEKQPFTAGTGGCESFRIPGLIRLADGGLFATVDARWTKPDDDCGGIDTMYAVSDDGGEHWRSGYAAYFPDTLGSPEDLSDASVCMDPMPVQTPDGVIHIFVNLGPTGITQALKFPGEGTGFVEIDGKRRLALTDDYSQTDDSPGGYAYYLGDYTDGYAPVLKRPARRTGYAVDAYFNICREAGGGYETVYQKQIGTDKDIAQNLFYRDSSFHVYNTLYTLHLYSADRASTWGCELISDRIKREDESSVIASPGNGTVMQSGVTVLPFYSVEKGRSSSFLVFSDDCCRTFYRSGCLPPAAGIPWSGECKPVELPDGRIRLFFRNDIKRICYADYDTSKKSWGEPVILPVLVHSDCNFSAVRYKSGILMSFARGVGRDAMHRSHGRMYVFRLDEDGGMALSDILPVNEEAFSYSVIAVEGERTAYVLFDTCGDGIVLFKKIFLPETLC